MPIGPELRMALLFGLLAFLAWLISKKILTSSELLLKHLESRDRILNRFPEADQLKDFVQSPEGKSLLELPHAATAAKPGLRLLQAGIISLPIGLGLKVASHHILAERISSAPEFQRGLLLSDAVQYDLLGNLLLALGLGLLLSGLLARHFSRAQ